MLVYSRNFLLSMCKCYKFASTDVGHGLVNPPLSRLVWQTLKSYNILKPFRGKRGSRRHRPSDSSAFGTTSLPHEAPTDKITNIFTNTSNIQGSNNNNDQWNNELTDSSLFVNNAGISYPAIAQEKKQIPTILRSTFKRIPSKREEKDQRGVNFANLISVNIKPRKAKGYSFPSIFFSNARSMVNKLDDIHGTIKSNACTIAVIIESWLSSCVTDDLISIPGYMTCRMDRPNDRRGGGICTYISSQVNFTELIELNDTNFECQWFLIKPDRLPRGINAIILGTVYHPPNNDNNELRIHLFSCLDKALASYPNSGIILLGDFNQFKPGNLCSSFKLKKLVTMATRGHNILDQAFSTLSTYYDSGKILPPLGLSDHSSVLLQPLNVVPSYQPTTRILKRTCKPTNKQAVYSSLQRCNWTQLYHLPTCDEQFSMFQSIINGTIDTYLPLRQYKLHPTDKPWFTDDIKDAIANRQRAWVNGNPTLYKFYKKKTIKLCKSARRKFYQSNVLNTQHSNPKKWWDNIKRLSGQSKSTSLSKMAVNGSAVSGLDLAEMINESFSNVNADMQPLHFVPTSIQDTPDEFIISPDAVESSLLGINIRKSIGPDNIPNWLLKDCASAISGPVASIFNASVNQGCVPHLWKSADVIPIAKAPKPTSIDSDLRPISLTTVLSKVLEDFIFSWLRPIIIPQLDTRQFGGIKHSSTTHVLVRLVHEWLQAAETSKAIVRSCLIDFSKAFDRIDHNILMQKLQILNVPPILLNWCAAFLRNRQQRVKLGQDKSNWKPIVAGVPQGTKLGPLLFLVMINDLTTEVPIYKYIDDCTVFEIISGFSTTSELQTYMNAINQWIVTNNMRINTKKTKELTICFAKSPPSLEPLTIDNIPIDSVKSTKLLGLLIQYDLKWDLHIETICSKASKRLYALRCLKRSGVTSNDLCSVYRCFVRPILEYACPVWHSSLTIALNDQLEQIQKRATKIMLPSLSYSDRLAQLNLITLHERREDLCLRFYKTISKPDDRINDILPTRTKPIKYSLRNPRSRPLIKCRTERFKNSFIPYAVKKWDS